MKRDLELLYEVGCFRLVQRTWSHFLFPNAANNADHSYRVMWTSLVIAQREGFADQERVLKMALVHDFPESRTGDPNYLSRQYIVRDDHKAVTDIFRDTVVGAEFKALSAEYSQRKTLAAKIVKDADNLDVDLELSELAATGNNLGKQFTKHRKLVYHMLYTKTAKQLWREIQTANPHDWHLRGRNRYNGGDWAAFRKNKPA